MTAGAPSHSNADSSGQTRVARSEHEGRGEDRTLPGAAALAPSSAQGGRPPEKRGLSQNTATTTCGGRRPTFSDVFMGESAR